MLCLHPPSSTGVNPEGAEQDVRGGWATAKLARPTGIVEGPPRAEARKDAECRHESLCVPSRYQRHSSPPKPRKHLQLNSHRLSGGLHQWKGALSLKAVAIQKRLAARTHKTWAETRACHPHDMTEKSKSKTLSTTTHAPVELEQVVHPKQ